MTLGSALTIAAYILGALVFWRRAREKRVATHGFALLAVWALCGGVLGAKVAEWALVLGADFWRRPLEFFALQSGGRTILGGVLGGWIGVEIGKRRLGHPALDGRSVRAGHSGWRSSGARGMLLQRLLPRPSLRSAFCRVPARRLASPDSALQRGFERFDLRSAVARTRQMAARGRRLEGVSGAVGRGALRYRSAPRSRCERKHWPDFRCAVDVPGPDRCGLRVAVASAAATHDAGRGGECSSPKLSDKYLRLPALCQRSMKAKEVIEGYGRSATARPAAADFE